MTNVDDDSDVTSLQSSLPVHQYAMSVQLTRATHPHARPPRPATHWAGQLLLGPSVTMTVAVSNEDTPSHPHNTHLQ